YQKSSRSSRAARWTAATAVPALAAGPAAMWLVTPAHAHGFGQRYDLPIPLSFYLFGTAVAVVVTFVMVALFVREHPRSCARTRPDLLSSSFRRLIAGSLPTP